MDDSCARTARFKLSRKVLSSVLKAVQVLKIVGSTPAIPSRYRVLTMPHYAEVRPCSTPADGSFSRGGKMFLCACLTLQTLWSSESVCLVGRSMLKLKDVDSLSLDHPSMTVQSAHTDGSNGDVDSSPRF